MEKDVIFPQNDVVMASASRGLTDEVGDRWKGKTFCTFSAHQNESTFISCRMKCTGESFPMRTGC